METPPSQLEKLENVFRSGLMLLGTYYTFRVFSSPTKPKVSTKVQVQAPFDWGYHTGRWWMAAQTPIGLAITFADMYLTHLAHTSSADLIATCPGISSPSSYRRSPFTLYLGLLALFAGAALRIRAYSTLKDAFTLDLKLHDGQKLVTTGLYAWVRHPSYTGLLLFQAATMAVYYRANGPLGCVDVAWGRVAVAATKWINVLYLIWWLLLIRIPNEEMLLGEWFQREWLDYANRTRRLIPGVY